MAIGRVPDTSQDALLGEGDELHGLKSEDCEDQIAVFGTLVVSQGYLVTKV